MTRIKNITCRFREWLVASWLSERVEVSLKRYRVPCASQRLVVAMRRSAREAYAGHLVSRHTGENNIYIKKRTRKARCCQS